MAVVAGVAARPAAAAPAPSFHRLRAERATASSFLKSNWNKYDENYHPSYILDDDPKTAWVEGAEGDGLGEWVAIPVSPLTSARTLRLVVKNGYQKRKDLLLANGAPQRLVVEVEGPDGATSVKHEATLTTSVIGAQTIELPLSHGIAEVRLTIGSVRAGTKYADTCISDVELWVDSDVPYVPTVEDKKHKALLGWKKQRLDVAKAFARLPPAYPFAATRFVANDVETPVQRDDFRVRSPLAAKQALGALLPAELGPLLDDVDTGPASAVPVEIVDRARGKRPPLPDGLDLLDAWATLDDVAVFEAKSDTDKRSEQWLGEDCDGPLRDPSCELVQQSITKKPVAVFEGEGAARHVALLYYEASELEEGRMVQRTSSHRLYAYDAQQHLVGAVTWDEREGDGSALPTSLSAVHVRWSKAGKIERARSITVDTEVLVVDLQAEPNS